MFNRYQEGERSQLQSPVMKTSENNKVEFHYFLPTSDSGEIQVTFSESNQPNEVPESSKIWQDTEGHGFIWNYGCMDLPSNKEGVLIFTGIVGQYQGFNMAIDDIVVSDGRCERKYWYKICKFFSWSIPNYLYRVVHKRLTHEKTAFITACEWTLLQWRFLWVVYLCATSFKSIL